MFNTTINVDAKPDWQTFYPPQLVGEYLVSLRGKFKPGQIVELKPGAVIFNPQPTLDGFLMWCAQPVKQKTKS